LSKFGDSLPLNVSVKGMMMVSNPCISFGIPLHTYTVLKEIG
jgi:hypothetical protein